MERYFPIIAGLIVLLFLLSVRASWRAIHGQGSKQRRLIMRRRMAADRRNEQVRQHKLHADPKFMRGIEQW